MPRLAIAVLIPLLASCSARPFHAADVPGVDGSADRIEPGADAPRTDAPSTADATMDVVDASIVDAAVDVVDAEVIDVAMDAADARVVDVTMDVADARVVDVTMDVTDARVVDATMDVADARVVDAAMDVADARVVDAPMDVADVPPCEGVQPLRCAGVCVDGYESLAHCGRCGTACGPGSVCLRGSCVDPVVIAGGTFAMGDAVATNAMPLQTMITVDRFALDATEVTIGRFRRFWDAGHPVPTAPVRYPSGTIVWEGLGVGEPGAHSLTHWTAVPTGLEMHPVDGVEWWTALAFCVWDGGRLPTEAEWEWAARSRPISGTTVPRPFPWGTGAPSATCDRAHWNNCPGDDGVTTRRVGSFAPTGGLYDLAGSLFEWTADREAGYNGDGNPCWANLPRSNPLCYGGFSAVARIMRGGALDSTEAVQLRGASRNDLPPLDPSQDVGFRCARAAP